MIIDAHMHLGLNGLDEYNLLKSLDERGIEKAWILTWDEMNPVLPLYYQPLDIEGVKALYKNHPDRIIPFYAPDPARSDWRERLSACLDAGFAGCGELKVPYDWDDASVNELLNFLNEKKLPLIFHMEKGRRVFIPGKDLGADWLFKRLINERFNGKSARWIFHISNSTGLLNSYLRRKTVAFDGYLMDFSKLENVIKQYPNIRFVAHGPEFWNQLDNKTVSHLFHQHGKINEHGRSIRLLKEYKNLFCDISGFSGYNALTRDPLFTSEFLANFAGKLLFGTDNFDKDVGEIVRKAGLTKEQEEKIFYKNAAMLINPGS